MPERPFFFYATNGELEAVRLGKWKLHTKKSKGWDKQENGTFRVSLYNLEKDISEKNNVANQFPEIVEKLRTILIKFDANFSKENSTL